MDKETRKKLGIDEQKPTDWFESLYAGSSEAGNGIPWANMSPHPLFKKWIEEHPVAGAGKTALVVGCGMGDDAIELESRGFAVTAFDVSHSAIELCKKRFPDSSVEFVQADLLEGIPAWHRKYDFVLEIFTIQALPPKYEQVLIEHVSDLVADGGWLAVITEVQHQKRTFEVGPPWLLNPDYIPSFEFHGLVPIFQQHDQPPSMGDEIHLTVFQRQA
ncbi:class I SAM-dependent methyltransferase [Pontibacter sp. G13]|uniref:class I SAM-dependent methyltransferase n=1 Tax=Pontibacter sp. G13 TaxID=3074898 RepID=UPI00288A95FB|nr:class I SAM-dependent methyltransferase [Pontibacter sp. G13]WNJ20925.1 class I SAM-dependent methyltransferase [Pontibacter sp. G13]